MKNLRKFENFSMGDEKKSREEMMEILLRNGYSAEECDSMSYDTMCDACTGCEMNEARKYTRKKTVKQEQAQAKKAQSQAKKNVSQAQKAVDQAQKALTQAQKEKAQAVQAQKSEKGADDVKSFSEVMKKARAAKSAQAQKPKTAQAQKAQAQKGAQKMTQKEKELAAKYPPKNKITKGDFIKAAIDNSKKKTTRRK